MVKIFKPILYYIAYMVSFACNAQQQVTTLRHKVTFQQTQVVKTQLLRLANIYVLNAEPQTSFSIMPSKRASLRIAPQASISIMPDTSVNSDADETASGPVSIPLSSPLISAPLPKTHHSSAVSEARQQNIVRLLKSHGPLLASELTALLGISGASTIYQHLYQLETVGLVQRNRSSPSAQIIWSLVSPEQDQPVREYIESQPREKRKSVQQASDPVMQPSLDNLSEIQLKILRVLTATSMITTPEILSYTRLPTWINMCYHTQKLKAMGLIKGIQDPSTRRPKYLWSSLVSPTDIALLLKDFENEPRKKQKLDQQAAEQCMQPPLDTHLVGPLRPINIGDLCTDDQAPMPLQSPTTLFPLPAFDWPANFGAAEAHTDTSTPDTFELCEKKSPGSVELPGDFDTWNSL